MTNDEAKQAIEAILSQVEERFTAVQVLATWETGQATHFLNLGRGNWYARTGMARDFLETDQARVNANEIRQILPDDEDGNQSFTP